MSRRDELEATVWPSDPHTGVKHLVYRHYANCWMAKILQSFPHAAIVDGFAGPGRYSDCVHKDGSPIVFAKAFLDHTSRDRFRRLHLFAQEERADRVDELARCFNRLPSHPHLQVEVQPAGTFADRRGQLDIVAHQWGANAPALWVLDPFNLKPLPFSEVLACLQRPRDEALVTFFTNEVYRHCTYEPWASTLDRYYGDDRWRQALSVTGERARKDALVDAYCEGFRREGLYARAFGVAVGNDTARYSIVYVTHSEYGLECWNPVMWRLDAYAGVGASAGTAGAATLFDDQPLDAPLRDALDALAGQTKTWSQLRSLALQVGFTEAQLRQTLTELAGDGHAIRESPLKSPRNSPWPEGCVVRFYTGASEPVEGDL